MDNKPALNTKKQELRTARLSVSFAIQEALEGGKILKKIDEILNKHKENVLASIKNRKLMNNNHPSIDFSGYELSCIKRALRDYITLRIANVVDPHPSASSLKDFSEIDLIGIIKLPEIKQILEARQNWIGHINKRYIGPIDTKKFYDKKITELLGFLQILVCTESITEKNYGK